MVCVCVCVCVCVYVCVCVCVSSLVCMVGVIFVYADTLEWTDLEWNIILWKAENREEWRKLVVKSTVVPQRSARLQDR